MTTGTVERLDDIPQHPSKITGIHRHPGVSSVVLSTSKNGCLKIHDEEKELCNLKINKTRILSSTMNRRCAYLSSYTSIMSYDLNTNQIMPYKIHFVNGQRMKLFQMENLLGIMDEKFIHIVDSEQRQLVQSIKTANSATGVQFFGDNELLYCVNDTIYHYDLRSQACINSFTESNYKTTSLAISGDCAHGYMATGSSNGMVHFYEWKNEIPTLLKEFGNLTTSINELQFCNQYLLMSSDIKKDQVRIVQIPQLQVLSNWPTGTTPLGYVQAASFVDNNLIVGNSKGQLRKFEIN
eukprot:NODE_380_length_9674_cov_0.149452.p5 type:complete len:295 gc:universal NODE_380_length_9674_cov_0.149452:2936-3820(+)